MYCKHCGSDMQEEKKICPSCGKENNENNIWKLLVVILCGLLLVVVITGVVLMAMGLIGPIDSGKKEDDDQTETTSQTDPSANSEPSQSQDSTEDPTQPIEQEDPLLPLGQIETYSATDEQVKVAADEIVATVGQQSLTNEQLQIYYWNQVYSFLYQYGTYYFDVSKGLELQSIDENMTWQEYFLTQALQMWQSYAVLLEQARADGYEYGVELQEYIEKLPQVMEEDATSYGYKDLSDMILKETGAGVTVDGFKEYRITMRKGALYFNDIYDHMQPTAQEIEERFEKEKDYYTGNNVTKESGNYVDVRHILIAFEEVEGEETPSDATKQKAKEKAEDIYNQWKNGDATEESFAALASQYTEDPGSKADGGLYTDVYKGQMVANFDAWCMDEARVKGDHTIVETEFGYHIMYFVGSREIWYAVTENDIVTERFDEFYSTAENAYPMEIFSDKIALGVVNLTQE